MHLPLQSPPGRVLWLIIMLPVSLLRSPRRRCIFHVIISLHTLSLPSHRRCRIGWSSLLVLWSSLALAWLHCPCPEFPGMSFRWMWCSRLGEGGLSSSLAHSCCSGITHRTLIVSVVLMRFAYRVDSPSLPSSIVLSSSLITPGTSSSNPPSFLKAFLLPPPPPPQLPPPPPSFLPPPCRPFPSSSLSIPPLVVVVSSHRPPTSWLPLHLSPSSVRPSREY